jgi:hypothetical protein
MIFADYERWIDDLAFSDFICHDDAFLAKHIIKLLFLRQMDKPLVYSTTKRKMCFEWLHFYSVFDTQTMMVCSFRTNIAHKFYKYSHNMPLQELTLFIVSIFDQELSTLFDHHQKKDN